MARIKIPSSALPGFEAISNLDPVQLDRISQYLITNPVGASLTELHEFLLEFLKASNAREIVNTLVSLSDLLSPPDVDLESLSNKLSESYIEQSSTLDNNSQLELKKQNLKNNLFQIFQNATNLKLTLKALDLIGGDNYVFRNSRIVTDIRPVFNDDLESNQRNAVIIHYLHIDYINEMPKKIILSLDLSDLKNLKGIIERAIAKNEIIKKDYQPPFTFLNLATDE